MTSEIESHFQRLSDLLTLEAEAAAARVQERLAKLSAADAEAAGLSLLDLLVVDVYGDLGGLLIWKLQKRTQGAALPWSRIGVGDPVILSREGFVLRGVVASKKSEALTIAIGDDDAEPPEDPLRVDLSSDEVTTRRQKLALQKVEGAAKNRTAELRDLSFGKRAPEFEATPVHLQDSALDASQAQAVAFALSSKDLALIHGPPGTGKTRTVVELMVQAATRGESILATAPSNLAVDNLVERLAARGLNVVRLGHPARISPTLLEHSLEVQVSEHPDVKLSRKLMREAWALRRQADKKTRTHQDRATRQGLRAEAKALIKDARRLERQTSARILAQAQVIAATTGFNDALLEGRRFDRVIVDEACQATEPGTWPPLLFAEAVVLAGDHQQLSATIVSPEAQAQGLGLSLFERLIARYGNRISRQLNVQYRMHAEIMAFSNQEFYQGSLVAADAVKGHRLSDLGLAATLDAPVTFIDTAGAGYQDQLEPDGESRLNPDEAHVVVKLVNQLLEAGLPARDVGIITPYAAQVRLLRGLLPFSDLEVDTVDGFQGREKEAIVISLVRANDDGELGFLTELRRTNVALTRARRKLVVIGDSATLASHPFYRRMLEHFEKNSEYRTVWEL